MSTVRRRDWVAKNMKKMYHGEAHKSKKGYSRKQINKELKDEIFKEGLPSN